MLNNRVIYEALFKNENILKIIGILERKYFFFLLLITKRKERKKKKGKEKKKEQ